MTPIVRDAEEREYPALASLWFHAWREAHEPYVPAELTRIRTLASFEERLRMFGRGLRLVGPIGAPLGLCVVKDDELNQLFTSPEARGTGAAQALIADAEARVAAAGHSMIWLDVVIENARAIRFYEKTGWRRKGEQIVGLDTLDQPFDLKVLIMEKSLM
ncbi:MAG: GNAT family N-acetyltransferase [Paracoccaceae bacterium]|jgi:GNAT superfamily N-acetyltransferase|nr:GNAT family N-acetyltransferase [Paracoccaceae bacterium]MDG1371225.1 GNAT family N-acetyltransferase [Paracoccaceae bacterium]MDG1972820.1 GNAT family N-acetyltransferase [Paracoccaceae bacterium]